MLVVEAVAPGVILEAEEGLHLIPALALQSPPGHGPDRLTLVPAAGPAPTHDLGLQSHRMYYIFLTNCNCSYDVTSA